ncbi:MAG: hypothetical protein HY876_03280 [Coriobacteriales bacterium]|nr:hypothetical protein [Coriobacteriales bacterium]
MTDEQRLDDPHDDALDAPASATADIGVEAGESEDRTPVAEMIPEPEAEAPEGGAVVHIMAEDDAAEDDAAEEQASEAQATEGDFIELGTPADPDAEVAPLTAADIPALDGCDVEKSWAGDETCEGTEELPVPHAEPESGTDLEAAEGEIAAATEEVAEGESALAAQSEAEATTAEEGAEMEAAESLVAAAPTWPFVAYLVLWGALCVLAGWQLSQIPIGQALSTTEIYRIAVIGGVVMTVAGPVLIFSVWLAAWLRAGDRSRAGLLASSLLKGSVVTLLGVVMWWGTFLIVDQLRFGRLM